MQGERENQEGEMFYVMLHRLQLNKEKKAKTDTDILHMHQDACQLHLGKHAASLRQHYTLKKSISLCLHDAQAKAGFYLST